MNERRGHRQHAFLSRWIAGVARHAPWIVLFGVLATGAALTYTAANLKIDTDREKMLSPELPFRKNHERYRKLFPQFVDNLVLVIDAESPERARSAAKALERALGERTDLFQSVYAPLADPFLERHGLLYLDEDELQDLSDRLAAVQPFLGKLTGDQSLRGLFALLESAIEAKDDGKIFDLGEIAAPLERAILAELAGERHRLSWQELMQDSGAEPDDRRQFVLAQPHLDYGRLFPAKPALQEIRRQAEALGIQPSRGATLRITGGLALSHEELETVARGAELIGILVFVLVAFVLAWGMRSLRLVLSALVTLVIGLSFTAAFATAAVGHLNLISVAFGVLYVGLGVDYAIHLCLRYQEERRRGTGHTAALQAAAGDVGRSLVICTLSTAIGFYAFVPTAYSGVSELGLISGTGMFVSLFANLTFLPALLSLWTRNADARTAPARFALSSFPVVHYRVVLVACVVLAVIALALVPSVRFDYNTLNLRDPESESVRTFRDLLRTSKTPPWSLTVLADDATSAASVAGRLDDLPLVDRVLTIASFIPEEQESKVEILEDTALVLGLELVSDATAPPPSVAEQVEALASLRSRLSAYLETPGGRTDDGAQALRGPLDLLHEAIGDEGDADLLDRLGVSALETLPESLALLNDALTARGFTQSEIPDRIVDRWVAKTGVHLVQAYPVEDLDDVPALRRFVAAVREVAPKATGTPVLMLESGEAVVGAFQQAIVVAVIATGLVLLLLLRRLADVALVLAPLIFAGVLTGGIMVVSGIEFNFANVIALPLLLGIGVDNGIHMVHRARHGSGGLANPLQTSTARAVVFSALTTLVSFGTLAVSPHRGTASMGVLLTIGIAMALLCTLVLLPALLQWTRIRAEERA